jgi:hypothetical protein
MKILFAALVAAVLSACVPSGQTDWGRVSQAAGVIVGEVGGDPVAMQAAATLRKYCPLLQAVALGATTVASERQQLAAQQAAAAVITACSAPTAANAEELARVAADAYNAVLRVKRGGI